MAYIRPSPLKQPTKKEMIAIAKRFIRRPSLS